MRLALLKKPLPGWRMGLAHAVGKALDHSPYSHGELVFSDRVTGSSWYRGGVDLRKMPEAHYFEGDRWDFYTLPDRYEWSARLWFEESKGVPYDIWGCVRFGVGLVPQDERGMYCHEAIASALGMADAWRLTGGGVLAQARTHWGAMRVLSPWPTGQLDDPELAKYFRTAA